MNVSLYLNHKTWVHRLDGRTKMLTVLGFFVLALCFSHPGYLLGVLALVVGALAVAQAGVNVKKIWVLASLLMCYSMMLWPFFVEGKTPVPSSPYFRSHMGRMLIWSRDGASVAHHDVGRCVAVLDNDY